MFLAAHTKSSNVLYDLTDQLASLSGSAVVVKPNWTMTLTRECEFPASIEGKSHVSASYIVTAIPVGEVKVDEGSSSSSS